MHFTVVPLLAFGLSCVAATAIPARLPQPHMEALATREKKQLAISCNGAPYEHVGHSLHFTVVVNDLPLTKRLRFCSALGMEKKMEKKRKQFNKLSGTEHKSARVTCKRVDDSARLNIFTDEQGQLWMESILNKWVQKNFKKKDFSIDCAIHGLVLSGQSEGNQASNQGGNDRGDDHESDDDESELRTLPPTPIDTLIIEETHDG